MKFLTKHFAMRTLMSIAILANVLISYNVRLVQAQQGVYPQCSPPPDIIWIERRLHWDGDPNHYFYEINFETDYLPGVLLGEVAPGPANIAYWHDNALRAMSVAARNWGAYFCHKHQLRDYQQNLVPYWGVWDNDTDQVYWPERTDVSDAEKDRYAARASDTSGIHMTFNNALFDAQYRAETGNPTDSWVSSGYAYLVGVPDPITTDATTGPGFSQIGSQRWASGSDPTPDDSFHPRWSNYQQILVHYYTGIHVRDGSANRLTPAYRWLPLSVDWHTPDNRLPTMYYTQTYMVTFWVQNVGTTTWPGSDQVYLSYHGWEPGGAQAQGVGISQAVAPGETITETLTLHPPASASPGTPHWLRFDMLLDPDGWFSELEPERPWPTYDVTVCVNGPCQVFLPLAMKNWTSVFLFDTFNPINPDWDFYTGTGCNLSEHVHVDTTNGHDDTYSLFITEQVGLNTCTSGTRITLSVPPGISPLTLAYWYRRDDPTYGKFRVRADDHVISSGWASSSWQRNTLDISAYAADGQVTLAFEVPNTLGNRHALLFDEITVSSQ